MTPQTGQIVRVRARQYLVEAVTPPPTGRDAMLVALSCLDDDAQGEPLQALWEAEVDAQAVEPALAAAIAQRNLFE